MEGQHGFGRLLFWSWLCLGAAGMSTLRGAEAWSVPVREPHPVILGAGVTGGFGSRLLIRDLDGDGLDDLAVEASGPDLYGGLGSLRLFFHRRSWPSRWDLFRTEADCVIHGPPGLALRLATVGDLNGDGRWDLVLVGPYGSGRLWILLGRGAWPSSIDLDLSPPDILIAGGTSREIRNAVAADFDGDGTDDLAVVLLEGAVMVVEVLPGRVDWPASIDFSTEGGMARFENLDVVYDRAPPAVLAGDLTADDLAELVVVDLQRTSVFRGRSPMPELRDASTDPADHVFSGSGFHGELADANGDGILDLMIDSNCGPDRVTIHGGGPAFGTLPPPLAEVGGKDLWSALIPAGVGDLDGDEELDLVLVHESGRGTRYRLEDAGGVSIVRGPLEDLQIEFSDEPADLELYPDRAGERMTSVASGDLDADGRTDLAIGSPGVGEVRLLLAPEFEPRPDPSAELFVDAARGSDAADGLAWNRAKASIGAALATLDGSRGEALIHVAEGIYREGVRVGFRTRLTGGYSAGGLDRSPTAYPSVLDATATDSAGVVLASESALHPSYLDGFVVTGGRSPGGGGIRMEGWGGVLANSIVYGNTAVAQLRPTLTPCPGPGGSTEYGTYCGQPQDGSLPGAGGGIYVHGSATLANNLVYDNRLAEEVVQACEPVPAGCEPSLSLGAMRGAGIYVDHTSTARLVNNTVWGNLGQGIHVAAPFGCAPQIIHHNIAWGNSDTDLTVTGGGEAVVDCNVLGAGSWFQGQGNSFDDPLLVDPAAGRFDLAQPEAGQSARSPGVDICATVTASSTRAGASVMSDLTTRSDQEPDAGSLDAGFHRHPANRPPLFSGAASAEPAGDCRVRLSWNAGSDREDDVPLRYLIFRAPSSGGQDFGSPQALVVAPTLAYLDEEVAWGEEPHYVVRAEDAHGAVDGNLREVVATVRDFSAPRITSLGAGATAGCAAFVAFTVEDTCSGLERLELHRGAAPDFQPEPGTLVAEDPVSGEQFPVPRDGFWYFRLVARDRAGHESRSRSAEARVTGCGGAALPPATALIHRMRRSPSSVEVDFRPADGATEHHLLRGTLAAWSMGGYDHGAGPGADGLEGTADDVGACRSIGGVALDAGGGVAGNVYYLIQGVNETGAGPLGTDSREQPRPGATELGTSACTF